MSRARRPARAARPTTAASLRRHLAVSTRRLGADELRVLVLLAQRLEAGRATYGDLALRRDHRDFRCEASEELLDATVYLAAELLRHGGPR